MGVKPPLPSFGLLLALAGRTGGTVRVLFQEHTTPAHLIAKITPPRDSKPRLAGEDGKPSHS